MATFGQSTEFSRVVNTTIAEYYRKEQVNVMRKRKLLAVAQEKGRVTHNHEGDEIAWPIRVRRTPLTPYTDMQALSFPRQNKHRNAKLPWRGYTVTDAMSLKERLMNKGQAARVKIATNIAKTLLEDIKDGFGDEFYIDGNANGYTDRLHGVESFFGNSGAASGGYIATPSDIYGQLSTGLAGLGGAWTGDWPDGTGDTIYDAWSPLIVDYTDTAWTASTKTWPNTCLEAIRFMILNLERNGTRPDLIVLNKNLYKAVLDKYDSKDTIQTQRGASSSLLQRLGFGDVLNYDGVDITWEYSVPANLGYALTFDDIEICTLQGQLFQPQEVDWSADNLTDRFTVYSFLNMKCNPRSQGKFINVT